MIKTLSKLGIDGIFLNLTKYIYKNHAANIFNSEKLEPFLLKFKKKRQECLLSPLLFKIILEVLDNIIRQEKEIKDIHMRKE